MTATPGSWVDVDPLAMAFFPAGSDEPWDAATPDTAAGFIERFDEMGTGLAPFEFTLTWCVTRFEVGQP